MHLKVLEFLILLRFYILFSSVFPAGWIIFKEKNIIQRYLWRYTFVKMLKIFDEEFNKVLLKYFTKILSILAIRALYSQSFLGYKTIRLCLLVINTLKTIAFQFVICTFTGQWKHYKSNSSKCWGNLSWKNIINGIFSWFGYFIYFSFFYCSSKLLWKIQGITWIKLKDQIM